MSYIQREFFGDRIRALRIQFCYRVRRFPWRLERNIKRRGYFILFLINLRVYALIFSQKLKTHEQTC